MTCARSLLALALTVGLAGPSARGDERCTLPNAGDWSAYRSKHFDLLTDASRFKAEVLASRLERTRALITRAVVGEDVEIPGRVRVLAFSSPSDFRRHTADAHGDAYFTVAGRTQQPTIVLYVAGVEADGQLVAHELAHHVSWYLFPRQPSWFSEGLATFVQSVADRETESTPAIGTHLSRGSRSTGGAGAVGVASPYLRRWLENAPAVSPKELLEWRGREHGSTGRFHVSSWLLYHFLWNTRSKAFGDFTSRLSNSEDPAAAWRAAFPDFDPGKPEAMKRLGEDLERFRRAGRYVYYRVEASADTALEPVPISRGDVHLAILETRFAGELSKDEYMARRRADLAEALRESPGHPVALAWLAQFEGNSVVQALRESTQKLPGDGRAWLELARALGGSEGAEREAALRQAAKLLPDDAQAHNALAWYLVETGRAKEALQFANRAADLAPWEPAIIDTLAAVAGKLGQCKAALQLERRALDLVREDASSEGYRKRLGALEAACASGAPAHP